MKPIVGSRAKYFQRPATFTDGREMIGIGTIIADGMDDDGDVMYEIALDVDAYGNEIQPARIHWGWINQFEFL